MFESIEVNRCSIPELARKWPVLTQKQRFKAINKLCEHPELWAEPLAWPERNLSHTERMERFLEIYQHAHTAPSLREILYRIFALQLKKEGHKPEIIRFSARSLFLKNQAKKAFFAKNLYRKAFNDTQKDGIWMGQVVPEWSMTLSQLANEIGTALASDTCQTLKLSDQGGVYATTLNDTAVIIKVFHTKQKLKDRLRPGRARKSWATAVSMRNMAIHTPRPLAYLESDYKNSCFITEAIPDAQTARSWVKPLLHRQNPAFQNRFRQQVLDSFITLYESGLYHGDTKLGNLLVTDPTDPSTRRLYWIDLDSVYPEKPSTRQVMRNLIQLNGSLGRGLSPAQRQAFLNDLAILYPWANSKRTWAHIEKITRKRLLRELHRICGH